MRKPRRRTVALVLLLVVGLLVAGIAWYTQPQPLLPEATASLASTTDVTFTRTDGRLEWAPADGAYDTGLVIYPGGKVPAEAYGPLAREIAAAGHLVVVMPMPLNLAVLGIGKADEAIAAHPEVDHWAIGGHSLGGSMACQYATDHGDRIEGLALWASYCATDLSTASMAAVSAYGSRDPGAARMSGADARVKLPADAAFVEIPGGNHEQMAWYTGQPNDGVPGITRENQQAQVAEATIRLLEALSAP